MLHRIQISKQLLSAAIGLLVLLAGCAPGQPAPVSTPVGVPTVPPTAQPPTLAPTAEPAPPYPDGVTLICATGQTFEDCANGARAITGEAGSGSFLLTPELFPDPTVALIDMTDFLKGQPEKFGSEAGQIMGYFTDPLFPLPGQVRVNLPLAPTGSSIDLKHDGQQDAGVQVYALRVSANLIGDGYLQQLEQVTGMKSFLTDVATGNITQGSFVVYAPDDAQSFPAAPGPDGTWFTDDDATLTLPAGYTVVTLKPEGTVTLDRSPEVAINTIERAEAKSPDFSGQGILESFNSLIDLLKERYAYTALRQLDWESIRAKYLPEVQAADASQDFVMYYLTLKAMAQSIGDGHVAATTTNVDENLADTKAYVDQIGGTLGASTIAVISPTEPLDSLGDQIVVLTVGPDTPAAKASWVPGTEIVSINGQPAAERLAEVPLPKSFGTLVSRRATQAKSILNFPVGQTVTIGYRLPDQTEVLTATMVTGDYSVGGSTPLTQRHTPVSFEQVGDFTVVRWANFMDNLLPKIAVLEEALANVGPGGVILDLRSNGGGLGELYQTMASYFFTADDPMPVNVFDWYYYDQQAGQHVRQYAPDYHVSAPRPELAYRGPVVVLVDEACASACEYFTQHLQLLKRATVIGQYPSDGAGGFIDRAKMPGDIMLQFTQGGTYLAGTNEPNLEAKGVVPDVRVPVSVETELAKQRGEDPVLQAALDYLSVKQNFLVGPTWQWSLYVDEAQQQIPIDTPDNYTVTFADDGTVVVKADCNQAGGTYTRGEADALTITLGPTTTAACAAASRSEQFLKLLSQATTSGQVDGQLVLTAVDNGKVSLLAFTPVK